MKRGTGIRVAVLLAAMFLFGSSTGCTRWLLGPHLASFGAGWLLRDAATTTTTERVCYHNGVLVDCSELPSDLGQ